MKDWVGVHEGTSYTVRLLPDRFALGVHPPGSPTVGADAEPYLSMTGEQLVSLLGELNLTSGELSGYVPSLCGEQWRKFWYLVSANVSSRFTWFDTDWD